MVVVLTAAWLGATAHAQAPDATLRVAQSQTIMTLDGGIEGQRQTISLLFHIYDPLFFTDRDGSVQPGLALGYEFVEPTVMRVRLRPDVTFHNGEPFNAETVQFSIMRTKDPELGSQQRVIYGPIEAVNVVDELTVDIVTGVPAPDLPQRLTIFPVTPRQYILDMGNDHISSNPIGTGPYQFVEWVRGSHVRLEANPDYWGGAPAIPNLVWREIPDDFARVNALLSGDVDFINNVPPDQFPNITLRSQFTAVSVPGVRGILVYFDTLQGPLADTRVRRALNYGVNVPEIIEFVLEGMGAPIINQTPAMYLGYDASLEGTYDFDPEKARELLAEAGYPDGFEITMYTPVGRYVKDREVAQAIAGQLTRLGLDVPVIANESAVNIRLLFDRHTVNDGSAAMFLLAYGLPVPEASLGWDEFLGTRSKTKLWVNPEFNALVDRMLVTIDPAEREALGFDAHRILVEEAPVIFMYQQSDGYAWANTVVDWEPRADELVHVKDMTLQ
jgi:peptide/nickel transport system substrate-binding protein